MLNITIKLGKFTTPSFACLLTSPFTLDSSPFTLDSSFPSGNVRQCQERCDFVMCRGIESKYVESLRTQCKVFIRVCKKSEPDRRFPQDIEITLYKVSVKLPLRIEKAENPLLVNVNIHHQRIGDNVLIQPKNPDNIPARIKLKFHIICFS